MDGHPALYSPTGYGIHDGEAVVRTPHAVKTLQGDHVEPVIELLAAMDGETAASDLIERVPAATAADVDLLYEHGLAYNADAIPTGLDDACTGLLEPALTAIPPENHHAVPDRLGSKSVAIYGHRDSVLPVVDRLRTAGVSVTTDSTDEPDVVLLSERLERSEAWAEANEQWAASESTLVKTRLTATGWRLGPVLTPTAPACLNCVYSRVDANKAGGQLFTEAVAGDPPYARAYADTVTELLFRTLLGQVPRYLDEQFVVYDHDDQTTKTPRVFALPHCEVCNV
ncbi:hypothetical protein [Halohasta salina]|uniref:hypothetical protein n=1 Tax=Halohasta salina TaxID=2961621 RepID=UPI0020A330CB|nr:hypothetical protein [Halohasta salina]